MGGRGSSSGIANTSYQGTQYAKAAGRGVTVDNMQTKLGGLSNSVMQDKNAEEALRQIEKAKNNPNATVTLYRATPGNSINANDWVFLSKAQAEKWTKTPFGTPKPGFKVLQKKVKAKKVDWSGKNLEFVYLGDR